jgi:threonine dehydratase
MHAWLPLAGDSVEMYLKMEHLQVSGGVMIRGLLNKVLRLADKHPLQGLVTGGMDRSSSSPWYLGVAHVGRILGLPVTIYINRRGIGREMVLKLAALDVQVVMTDGSAVDAANAARRMAERAGLTFVNRGLDTALMAGLGGVALEILEAISGIGTVIVPLSGGALAGSTALVLKEHDPCIRVVAVMAAAGSGLQPRRRLTGGVAPVSPSLARSVASWAFNEHSRLVDELVCVTPGEAHDAARVLWSELAVATEATGAWGVAALLHGRMLPANDRPTCVIVTRGGIDGFF